MAKLPNPVYTYANVNVPNGGYTSNVTLNGGAGLTYSIGSGAGTWASTTAAASPYYTQQPKVKITDSDIELDGLSLKQTLLAVNERLAVMIPNPALEKEFDELKACGDEYRRLEREFQDQIRMWNTLKSTDTK
jgi:hypothetical protein